MKFVRAQDGAICGVAKGLARSLEIPVGIFRLMWILSILCLGTGVLLYVILAICLPREDKIEESRQPKILGVCAKIARRNDLEPGIVRFLAVCLLPLSFGATLVGYIVLYFILDDGKRQVSSDNKPSTPPVTT